MTAIKSSTELKTSILFRIASRHSHTCAGFFNKRTRMKTEIYDTTLRDGAQSEGINFSVSDKIKIIKLLDALGIDYIEAGWPGANPVDEEVFREIENLKLKSARITAFGCTKKPKVRPEDDKVLNMLLSANTEIITIFGKTWDFHVTEALNTTLEENLNMIRESVKYLKQNGRQVFFDAEHFLTVIKTIPIMQLQQKSQRMKQAQNALYCVIQTAVV